MHSHMSTLVLERYLGLLCAHPLKMPFLPGQNIWRTLYMRPKSISEDIYCNSWHSPLYICWFGIGRVSQKYKIPMAL